MKPLVLFIHGLGGSADSWGKFDSLLRQDDITNNRVDIDFYKYPSKILYIFKTAIELPVLSDALKTLIEVNYRDYAQIIIVAHSMGGIIARHYILNAIRNGKALRVKHLICFATPHSGSELANIGSLINGGKHENLKNLRVGSEFLSTLNMDWLAHRCASHLSMTYVRGGIDDVVNALSAAGPAIEGTLFTIPDKNHTSIVKPDTGAETSYLIVRNAIEALLCGGNIELGKAHSALQERDLSLLASLISKHGRSWIETNDHDKARALFDAVIGQAPDNSEAAIWSLYLAAISRLFSSNEASATAIPDDLVARAKPLGMDVLFVAERMEFARKADELDPAVEIAKSVEKMLKNDDSVRSLSSSYARGTARFLMGNLLRRGGRYHEALDELGDARKEFRSIFPSHQIELAHCSYAEMICRAMIGQPILFEHLDLVSAELRQFSEGLLMIADSHRSWLKSDSGAAAQRSSDASIHFTTLRFAPYATRANNLTELLKIWQGLSLGAKADDVAILSPEKGPLIRAMLGVKDADDIIRQRLNKMRPSKAIGMLQFATNFSLNVSRDIGDFDLPRVLRCSTDGMMWDQKKARSLEEADRILREQMGLAANTPVPLAAD
jgi:pimeloyl-ACP methyl ester carboxylesterase